MNYHKPAQVVFAAITLLSLLMALAAPAPVYAGAPGPGEPPPPNTPSNDLGGLDPGADMDAPPPPSSGTGAAPSGTNNKVISAADIFVLDAAGKVVPLSSIGPAAALEAKFCTVDLLGGSETCHPAVATLSAAMNQAKSYNYNQIVPEGMLVRLGKGDFAEGISMDLLTFFTGVQQPYGIGFSGQSTTSQPRSTIIDSVYIYNSYPTLNYITINGLAIDHDLQIGAVPTHDYINLAATLPSHIDLTNLQVGDALSVGSSSGKLTLKNVTLTPSTPEELDSGDPLVAPIPGITIIGHSGNVSLDHVISTSQPGYGAQILTFSALAPVDGVPATARDIPGANVTIQNSQFNHNNLFGLMVLSAGDISLKNVNANGNGLWGAELIGGIFLGPNVQGEAGGTVKVENSNFNNNLLFGLMAINNNHITLGDVVANGTPIGIEAGSGSGDILLNSVTATGNAEDGIIILSPGMITLNHVIASDNGGDGIYIVTSPEGGVGGTGIPGGAEGFPSVNLICTITQNNQAHGLDINADEVTPIELTSVISSDNTDGDFFSNTPTTNPSVDCNWPESSIGAKLGVNGDPILYPIQIIRVYRPAPNKGSGILSHLFSTIFLYVEKQPDNQPDIEWARVLLPVGVAPSGSTATFEGLTQEALPGPLPEGATFQGPAFNMIFTSPEGGNITGLAGNFMVQFNLPEGFTTPAGKKLAILWYDEVARDWVKLTTYTGANFAYAYASKPGKFVLVLEPA